MKLRLKDDSIRLRLSQTEMKDLGTNGVIESQTHFVGGNQLNYILLVKDNYDATFSEGSIKVSLPISEVSNWIKSVELSLEHFILLPDDKKLRILVEKDLKCLTERPFENEEDLFPNPNKNC